MDTSPPTNYLDLYDFRRRVTAMYQRRNRSLEHEGDPQQVLDTFRTERDELFATHPQSALDEDQKRGFHRLGYFAYNPEACVEAVVERAMAPRELVIQLGGTEEVTVVSAATLRFTLSEQPVSLALYWIEVYGGGLFLPFHDLTSPDESYGGGRYLFDTVKGSDFRLLDDRAGEQRMLLDFNYAYNPSCAYNPRWVCPLAPRENHLPGAIRAGERKW